MGHWAKMDYAEAFNSVKQQLQNNNFIDSCVSFVCKLKNTCEKMLSRMVCKIQWPF